MKYTREFLAGDTVGLCVTAGGFMGKTTVSPAAGFGFRGLASRARAAGEAVAQTAQERWQGQGVDSHGAWDGGVGMGDLLPPPGSETSWQALRWCLCRPGTVGDLRSLYPSVGHRGEPVGGDVGLFGRGAGRVGRPGCGVGYQNGATDRVPLCGPGEARAT